MHHTDLIDEATGNIILWLFMLEFSGSIYVSDLAVSKMEMSKVRAKAH